MKHRDLDRALRQVHRRPAATDRARHRQTLADELGARHARLYHRRKWIIMKQSTWMRPLLACLIVAVLGVAACQTPTEYEVPMGQQLQLDLSDVAKNGGPGGDIEAVLRFCEGWPGVEELGIEEAITDGGGVAVGITMWGQNLDGDTLMAALQQQFPWLDDSAVTIEPLNGTMAGSLIERMGHALFHIEVDGDTAEEIRAQILAQLQEQGFDGDAVVDVQVGDGHETITIEMTGDIQAVEGDSTVANPEFFIERQTD